ncbi:MAG: hypothetical protein A2X49_09440, partial [Lentisphaerae bacterium GWF2_52_8]
MLIPKIRSIRTKIIASIVLVCVLTMTTGFVIVLVEDIGKIKQTAANQAAMVATVIGESCVSAITFNYPENAEKSLRLIGALAGFENARIYTTNGELFAAYDKTEKIAGPNVKELKRSREYIDGDLHLIEPIVYQDKSYGQIYLRVHPSFETAIRSRVVTMGGVLLGLLSLSYLLATLVQRIISRPILLLADTAEKISREMDYSLRLENTNTGEIGSLFDAFNSMLGAIQQREIERSRAESDLQFKERVIESTTSCIATADLRGLITYANPSFLKLFGVFRLDEVLNKSFSRFFVANEVFDRMLVSLTNQESWTMEIKAKKTDGTGFDAIISADTVKDSGDNQCSLVITVSDISELRRASREMELENWLKSGQGAIYDRLRGEQEVRGLADNLLRGLKEQIDFQVGAIYVAGEQRLLFLAGSYALHPTARVREKCRFGEGLVGQAALDRHTIMVSNLPEDYIRISSGVGEAAPRFLLAMPFIFEGRVKGVLELGSFNEFKEKELELLERLTATIAIAVHTAQAREQVQHLLEKTQAQSEELQAQTEELRTQQEELQQTNQELEEQRDGVKKKNDELEKARGLVERKAADLEIASRYKSEFLANMSHELRTPLNSIMLLSDVLMENRDGSLSEKHLEFVANINESGTDLLTLINDVLDLSKVESGRMELMVEDIFFADLLAGIERAFGPLSVEKCLPLITGIRENVVPNIRSDRQKIEQVLKNLLSNAFKFTENGQVSLFIDKPDARLMKSLPALDPERSVVFTVTDTGIGIPEDKQALIFEAFMQVDGTTSRKYGGTGLGLSISREIAGLLGGDLIVTSKPGQGSTFSLVLPRNLVGWEKIAPPPSMAALAGGDAARTPLTAKDDDESARTLCEARDDRNDLAKGDRSILIIEDDSKFNAILLELAHEQGFKAIIAEDGKTGLYFADYYHPSAVILDLGLPGLDGWEVMGRLKSNLATRHIPVHIISASEKKWEAMKMGAVDFLRKPVSIDKLERAFGKIGDFLAKPVRNLMVAGDNEGQIEEIKELIGNGDVRISGVKTGREAIEQLLVGRFDCLILDLNLPDMSGEELLTTIKNEESLHGLPVIVYTGKDLSYQEKVTLQSYAENIIIRGVNSLERLLDETTLFLHRVETSLCQTKREMLHRIHDQRSPLKGKHILLVDDDMRNVFAISSILEDKGMTITICKNGREALRALDEHPAARLVLMDMMMPEMDGYQAMGEIRKQKRFEKLPIIAITAKAMMGDRCKCIEA